MSMTLASDPWLVSMLFCLAGWFTGSAERRCFSSKPKYLLEQPAISQWWLVFYSWAGDKGAVGWGGGRTYSYRSDSIFSYWFYSIAFIFLPVYTGIHWLPDLASGPLMLILILSLLLIAISNSLSIKVGM